MLLSVQLLRHVAMHRPEMQIERPPPSVEPEAAEDSAPPVAVDNEDLLLRRSMKRNAPRLHVNNNRKTTAQRTACLLACRES